MDGAMLGAVPSASAVPKSLLERHLETLFLGVGGAVALLGVGSYFVWAAFLDTDRRVHHAHDVIVQAHTSLLEATKLQASYRGFALTRDPRFLTDYQAAETELAPSLQKLRELAKPSPSDDARLVELEALADKIKALGSEIVKAAQADPSLAPLPRLIRLEAGQAALERFSTVVASLEKEQGSLLAEYTGRHRGLSGFVFVLLCLAYLVFCGALVWSYVRVRHDLERRRSAETSFRALLAHVPDATLGVDASGTIRIASEATERVLGYRPEELVGCPIETLVPSGIREPHVALRNRYLASPVRREMGAGLKLRARHKDGHEFATEIGLSPVPAGKMVIATVRDITLRVEAEESLRQSEIRFRELFDQSADAIWIVTPAGRVTHANRATETLLGYSSEEIANLDVEILICPEDRPKLVQTRARLLQSGGEPELCDWRLVRKDETRVPVEIRTKILQSGQWQFVARDVTERAALETELRRSNEDLERFAYGVSHDLQEPLRTITTYLSVLDKSVGGTADATAREALAYTRESARRMRDQIAALLQYSRAGHGRVEKQSVDAEALLRQVAADLRPLVEMSEGKIEGHLLPTLDVDPYLFEQLLLNLVTNSLKYRGPLPPRVTISAEKANGAGWIFSVADNGVGVPEGAREKIFEPFQRLHGRKIPGSGIGLATCRRILDRLGGKIWVESNAAGGATFRFTLPT